MSLVQPLIRDNSGDVSGSRAMVKLRLTMVTIYAVVVLAVVPTIQGQHSDRPAVEISDRFEYFDKDLMRFMDDRQNYIISPAAIKATLAMVLEGARGRSGTEIANVLRIPSDLSSARDKLQRLFNNNASSTNTLMEDANTIFISDAYHSFPEFEKILKNYYRASVKHLNFANSQNTAALINNWVSDATRGHITEMVEPGNISANAALILVSALYFKGEWTHGFDKQLTSMKCFRNSRSKCIATPMMHTSRIFKYKAMAELEAQALQLPYGNGEYAMLVILPNEKNSVEVLISDLQHIAFSSVVNKLEPVEVVVSLPKFDIQYTADLVAELQTLGIRDVFGQSANLSGIAQGEQLKINNIMHEARFEVDERGAVASTITSIDLISIPGMELPRLNVNRPFLFFIYHVPTNSIILEGRINEPVNAYNSIFGVTTTSKPVQKPYRPQNVQGSIDKQELLAIRSNAGAELLIFPINATHVAAG